MRNNVEFTVAAVNAIVAIDPEIPINRTFAGMRQ
jgi:hypothetical protein